MNQATGSDRRIPGKTQLLPYPIKSSSGLSTKNRIAEDMAKSPVSFGQSKSKYQGLSMRRNVNPLGESRSPIIPSTTNPQSPLDASQMTPLPRPSNEHSSQPQIRKASLQEHPPPPLRAEELPHDIELDHMDVDQPDSPPSPPRQENLTAADDLLHTIIPQQIPELMPKVLEQPVARATTKVKLSELSRRDTKWSGTLFNSVSEIDAEKLCEVTIQDHTPARGGMKLDLFLQKLDSIRLKKFHDLTDLDLLLPSFQQIAQFASLVPCEEKDQKAFTTTRDYLLLKEKFTYCTLSFVNEVQVETDTVAYMLITPMSKPVFALLGASEHREDKNALLVALAPLVVQTKKYQEEMAIFKPSEEVKKRLPTLSDLENTASLSTYHLARHTLRVPKSLVAFLSSNPRPCIIWPRENAPNDVWISQDTQYLRFVLDHHRAKVFSPKDHVAARIVFVHVGRMKDMHTMPRIARLRGTHLDLQFLTYGAHPTVPAREWGIRGFNISGGILTFTPNALVHSLDSVDRLIERVASHEHWACYVTPVVLGAAVRWAKELENPALAAVIFDRLGKRISEGKIACMIAPPTNSHLSRHAKDCETWVEFHHMQSQLDPQEIVDDCEDMYDDAYRDVPKRDRDGFVLSDLQQDLVKMSNQPAFKYDYRRFVIVKSNADMHDRPGEEDWCEWKLVSEFRFGDEVDT
ncbi:hypothetical protein BDM02DRAFT_2656082 [Thelephora ganbajun]|uniref:Uncharacterized protein n=1 Tax=Thelephora ganbajun TaxID=370292 RepID=A0ACB6ZCS7_THEGA|nr:hypothetical protein BDM02DRAFT_2656082 [Thelephora ganbajun]